jgi:methyl acetate hydrolase
VRAWRAIERWREHAAVSGVDKVLRAAIDRGGVPGGRRADALCWAGLGNTYFWIDPAQGVAGVILMQFLPFADPKALALLDDFEKAIYAGMA